MKLFSFTEKKESIFKYTPWFLQRQNTWIKINLEYRKNKKRFFLIKIYNINDRTSATQLINLNISTEKNKLPILDMNEYYWHDLIKCRVISTHGYYLGIVENLIHTGSNDVLILKNKNKENILIPFLNGKIIKKVDVHNSIIQVDWNYSLEK